MEDVVRYLDEIVKPTIIDLEKNPTSVRHAFLACVAVFHTMAFPHRKGHRVALREKFRKKSPEFAVETPMQTFLDAMPMTKEKMIAA